MIDPDFDPLAQLERITRRLYQQDRLIELLMQSHNLNSAALESFVQQQADLTRAVASNTTNIAAISVKLNATK